MSAHEIRAKVAKSTGESKTEVGSGKFSPTDLALVDAAAQRLGVRRTHVIEQGTMRYVREVLGLPVAA